LDEKTERMFFNTGYFGQLSMQSVTQGSSRAARILKTLGIEDLDPAPKKARERVA